MNIIIAGSGKTGSSLTRLLAKEGHNLTLIDQLADLLDRAVNQYDVMAVHGNCAAMPVLYQAGIQEADLLIATTGTDELNLLCCMTAHVLNPNLHTIARIHNPEYNDQIFKMRDLFSLNMVFNPDRQAAKEVERLLRYPGFLRRDTFAGGRVEIVELRVAADSRLCGVALSDLDAVVKCKVLICTVLRNGRAVTPNGGFVLQEGDRIFVTASVDTLSLLLKNLGGAPRRARRVMICGGSTISYYLAKSLEKSGTAVQIIEQNGDRCRDLAAKLPHAYIVHGDASNVELLDSEGLAGCDALVTATGMDELNMIISLYGNRSGVPQIITKLGRGAVGNMADALPLGSTICPKELCSTAVVRYVRALQNQTGAAISMHSIADGQTEALEFPVDESTAHRGEPLRKLKIRKGVLLACIMHKNRLELPGGDSVFEAGDTVILVTSTHDVIYALNDIFV